MNGFIKALWQVSLAFTVGVGLLFCVIAVIGRPEYGEFYWFACCTGGAAVGIGAKLDFMKFKWVIATIAFLLAIKLFSLIPGRPLQYADLRTGCMVFFIVSVLEYCMINPTKLK